MKNNFLLLAGMALLNISCNKNSNELPAPSSVNASFNQPLVLFDNRADLLSAQFSRYRSQSHDSVFVAFNNLSDTLLANLRLVVEASSSLPETYDNSVVCFDRVLTLEAKKSTGRFAIAVDKSLPFESKYYRVYVLSGTGLAPLSTFSGTYQNRFSVFRNDTAITTYPQLFGFVQVDGKSVFRIKISDSLYYTIPNGKFQTDKRFSGTLMANGQILSYLSLDTTATSSSGNNVQWKLVLSKPLPDGSKNLIIDALKY